MRCRELVDFEDFIFLLFKWITSHFRFDLGVLGVAFDLLYNLKVAFILAGVEDTWIIELKSLSSIKYTNLKSEKFHWMLCKV